MNKKYIIYVLVFILVGVLVVIGISLLKNIWNPCVAKQEAVVYNGILYVNNQLVDDKVFLCYKEDYSSYSKLPLIKLFKALGAQVRWEDSDTAEILFEGKKYTLCLSDATLFEEGNITTNLIALKDGGTIEYEKLEQELILDSSSVTIAFYTIGHPIEENLDFQDKIVNVTSISKTANQGTVSVKPGKTGDGKIGDGSLS